MKRKVHQGKVRLLTKLGKSEVALPEQMKNKKND